jgi:Tol biopolymer transport system component
MTAEMKVDDWHYLPFTDIYNISAGGASTMAVRITNPNPTAPRLGPSVNHPAVSPDSTSILVNTSGSGSGYDLYLLDMTGAVVKRLTNTGQIEDQAAWSPDGKSIVYREFSYGSGSIKMMNADGSNVRYVTLPQYNDADPSVGPAGLLPSPAATVP